MEGMRRVLQNQKFSECKAAEDAVRDYQMESDTVAMFLKERGWVASTESTVRKNILYNDYKIFCKEDGMGTPLSKIIFGKGMIRHGIEESKSGGVRSWRLKKGGPAPTVTLAAPGDTPDPTATATATAAAVA